MPTLVELLEAGVQFGHKKHKSHPKAQEYIFTLREGVYVIDLEKTVAYMERALEYLKKEINLGKTVLFVGTKRQAKDITKEVAKALNMPYVTHRWLGGTLTNFETLNRSLKTLEKLTAEVNSPEFESLTKKEKKMINDKVAKLELMFGGVKDMKRLPDALFIVDGKGEEIAVKEAAIVGIPCMAICDTDVDPSKITYPIPANDDAPKSLNFIMNIVKEAGMEAEGSIKNQEESIKEEGEGIKNKEVSIQEEKIKIEKKETEKSVEKAEKKTVKKVTKKIVSKVKKEK